MIKVDIATKIVSPDTAIWVVFPGRGRRLIKMFLGNNAIFLETPGIEITPELLVNNRTNTDILRQHVRMSVAIANYTLSRSSTSKLVEMQWKAVELGIIFENRSGLRIVSEYQKSLDEVRTALLNLKSKSDLVSSQDAVERFAEKTLSVVRELANLGGLRLSNKSAPKT